MASATMEKPAAKKTEQPEPPGPRPGTPEQLERAKKLNDCIDKVFGLLEKCRQADTDVPVEFLESLHGLFETFLSRREVPWFDTHYPIREEVVRLAKVVNKVGQPGLKKSWEGIGIGHQLNRLAKESHPKWDTSDHADLLATEDRPESHWIELKTLTELREEKVPDGQVCSIFGWKDEHGRTQMYKLRQALRGELEPPRYKVTQWKPRPYLDVSPVEGARAKLEQAMGIVGTKFV